MWWALRKDNLICWKFDQISFRLWHNMAKKVNPKFDLGAQADVWLVTPPDRTREEPTARWPLSCRMVGFLEGKVVVLQDFGFPHGPRLGRGRSECLLIFIFSFLIYLKIDLLEIYASTMRLFYVSVCGFLSDSTLFGAWFTTMKN